MKLEKNIISILKALKMDGLVNGSLDYLLLQYNSYNNDKESGRIC